MQTRPLPGSDWRVSAMTFGTMRLASKEPNDHASFSVEKPGLSVAMDAGTNIVHSSDGYGARCVLSECFREHPKRHELYTDRVTFAQHLQRGVPEPTVFHPS